MPKSEPCRGLEERRAGIFTNQNRFVYKNFQWFSIIIRIKGKEKRKRTGGVEQQILLGKEQKEEELEQNGKDTSG